MDADDVMDGAEDDSLLISEESMGAAAGVNRMLRSTKDAMLTRSCTAKSRSHRHSFKACVCERFVKVFKPSSSKSSKGGKEKIATCATE